MKYRLIILLFISFGAAYPMMESCSSAGLYVAKQAVGVYAALAMPFVVHEMAHAATSCVLHGPSTVKGFCFGDFADEEIKEGKFFHVKGLFPRSLGALIDLPPADSKARKIKNFTVSAVGPLAGEATATYLFSKFFPGDDGNKILKNLPIALALMYCMPANYFNYLDINPKRIAGIQTDGYRMRQLLSVDREDYNDVVKLIGISGMIAGVGIVAHRICASLEK